MRFLIPHVITVLTLFIISLAANRGSHTDIKDKNGNFIVKQPKVLFAIGLLVSLGLLLFLILMYCFPNPTARWWIYCLFTAFVFLGCYFMYLTVSWRITYSPETDFFVYRSVLLRSRRYYYRDCHCRFETGEIIITNDADSCKIHIPKEAIGFDRFVQIVRQKCQIRKKQTINEHKNGI